MQATKQLDIMEVQAAIRRLLKWLNGFHESSLYEDYQQHEHFTDNEYGNTLGILREFANPQNQPKLFLATYTVYDGGIEYCQYAVTTALDMTKATEKAEKWQREFWCDEEARTKKFTDEQHGTWNYDMTAHIKLSSVRETTAQQVLDQLKMS